jgi:hypothetical protein
MKIKVYSENRLGEALGLLLEAYGESVSSYEVMGSRITLWFWERLDGVHVAKYLMSLHDALAIDCDWEII